MLELSLLIAAFIAAADTTAPLDTVEAVPEKPNFLYVVCTELITAFTSAADMPLFLIIDIIAPPVTYDIELSRASSALIRVSSSFICSACV